MNKVVFLATIYPMDESYVDAFFNSLVNQTVSSFDVIIVNDGFSNLEKYKHKYANLNIIEIDSCRNIAKNREISIRYAIDKQYDIAVFGDVDDYFEANRVEVSESLLSSNDIVINDLVSFSGEQILNRKVLSSRIKNLSDVSLDFILEKNVFGLSNTAIKLDGLNSNDIVFPSELVAVDWYFFSNLLLLGKRAIFTNETTTYYRQHDSNIIGIGDTSERSILKTIQVKLIHYRNMQQKNELFVSALERTEILSKWIDSKVNMRAFARKNNEEIPEPLWWEITELGEKL